MLLQVFSLPLKNPVLIFSLILFIILLTPVLLQRLRIPDLIGLIIAGAVIGPNGVGIMERDSSIELFGTVGLLYIMFIAGLEIDMADLKKNYGKTLTFGLYTFLIPMIVGTLTGVYWLDFSWPTSIFLASMYASLTLITYPIVSKYGITKNRAVSIAIGGTVITCILALLVLAVIVGMSTGEINQQFWIKLGVSSLVFISIVVILFPMLGRWFFKRYEDSVGQYIFVLALVFFASFLAEAAGLEAIIGAFLAGLALNRLIPNTSALMNRIDFVGNAIFIPFFLIGVGMLVDVRTFAAGWTALWVAVVMTVIATLSKFMAAWITEKNFKLTRDEGRLIFGLSNAQAAATLAAVLVGYNIILPSGERLLNEDVLNGTILLILVTCVVSSLITDVAARRLALQDGNINESRPLDEESALIALAYPDTVDDLVNMALLMRKDKSDAPMSAINVVLDNDDKAREKGMKLLEAASAVTSAANVQMQTKVRLATNLANGIIHSMKENDYSELVVGLHMQNSPSESFFGPVLISLLNRLNRQITMIRCTVPVNTIRRIHVAVPAKAQFEAGFYHWVERVARLAVGLGCRIIYHAHPDTIRILQRYLETYHASIRAEYVQTDGGNELKRISREVREDHMLVVVLARRGSISFRPSFDHIPRQIKKYYMNTGLMLIFPDVYAEAATKDVSVNEPLTTDLRYEAAKEWYKNWLSRSNGKEESQ